MEIFIGLAGKTLSSSTAQAGDGDGMLGAGAWGGEDGAAAAQEMGIFLQSKNSSEIPAVFLRVPPTAASCSWLFVDLLLCS